jgi:DNA-damage-inducible protein J
VREAMDDSGPTHSHEDVMAAATELLERKRGAET